MVEKCFSNLTGYDTGKVPLYMWIRRLYDTADLHIHVDSIYIKKQVDVITEYEHIMPLIDTIFERILGERDLTHPEVIEQVGLVKTINMTKDYDLKTLDGVIESIAAMMQLLELYINIKEKGKYLYIDLFCLVLYHLLYNIKVINGVEHDMQYKDIRGVLYVQGIRP